MSEINVTPLVDVMLVLLVVFIVTAPLLTNAIHVTLPKTEKTAAPDEPQAVTVSVDASEKIFIEKRQIAVTTLESELRTLKDRHKDLTLYLQADDASHYGIVAKVMAAIERSGVAKVAVITEAH
ncbi:MAG: biopolymer transporter ExbD [Gammaproteobacteria bacterium]|nr:biopolymer transporter ExbD [Gammaproteobacteria bacterium]